MTAAERRDTLIKLVRKLTAIEGTEAELDEVAQEISRLSPDPEWSNYIFYSDDYVLDDGQVDAEAVVEKMLSCRPILL